MHPSGLQERIPLEGRPPDQQEVQNTADRVEIAPSLRDPTAGLLGRHVLGRSQHRRQSAPRVLVLDEPRHPEVRDLHPAVRREQHPRRTQVAVHHPGPVRAVQRRADLSRPAQRLPQRHRRPGGDGLVDQDVGGGAVERLGHQVRNGDAVEIAAPEVVHGEDGRMREPPGGAGLVGEAREDLLVAVAAAQVRQQPDRHVADHPFVDGPPALAGAVRRDL
jgi:hypothetical protein